MAATAAAEQPKGDVKEPPAAAAAETAEQPEAAALAANSANKEPAESALSETANKEPVEQQPSPAMAGDKNKSAQGDGEDKG